MPRPSETALYELAEGQDGYFTALQAHEAGVSPHALSRATISGRVARLSRGVYRLTQFPSTGMNAHYWEAILWPQIGKGVTGVLSHYTALRLHELSDVNPTQTHITVPRDIRIRREPPDSLVVHHAHIPRHDVTYVDGLPVTTVQRTLLDIAEMDDPVALHDAIRDARERKISIPRELARV